MNLRSRRMEEEWQLLEKLASVNPCVLVNISRSLKEFRIVLRNSPAWIQAEDKLRIENEHVVRYVYPRYYPTLPIEGYFTCPIVHLNVDPLTGFVCLWDQYRPSQTIVDAILITRAIMAWKIANRDPAHCMQPGAFSEIPEVQPLIVPEDCRPMLLHQKRRQRLSFDCDSPATQEADCALSHTE